MIKLTESQKFDIISILKDLAAIDRNFDLLEAIRIRLIGLKMDLHANKIDEALAEDYETLVQIKKRLESFTDDTAKKYLYQQCLLLLMADGNIGDHEKEMIDEIRDTLGLDISFHESVLTWVEEGMQWEAKGQELVGGALSDNSF
jgi:hypothetical protein